MTLIEVTVSMFVLFVAVGATLGTLSSFAGLEESNRETMIAQMGAHRMIERLQAEDFRTLFANYNAVPADDPGGAGTAPGAGFAVGGLDAQDADPDGFVGLIMFPVAAPGVLREDTVDEDFAMPLDLNADGVVDALNHANDYVALPVRVRIEWQGRSGNRSVELQTLISFH